MNVATAVEVTQIVPLALQATWLNMRACESWLHP